MPHLVPCRSERRYPRSHWKTLWLSVDTTNVRSSSTPTSLSQADALASYAACSSRQMSPLTPVRAGAYGLVPPLQGDPNSRAHSFAAACRTSATTGNPQRSHKTWTGRASCATRLSMPTALARHPAKW